ncbi:MAG: putative thiol peroxidase [Dehalococcoidia bacterium]|nr:putative thiol peroxidase [Chloroflexota bacterium]MBT9162230.1 putative thiol peroxidase [Chloroflexota bacterium]
MERTNIVKFKGNPLTLVGPELKAGDKAPDFTVLNGDLKEVRLNDFEGKVKIISVTPSLDTPVCDMQANRFNEDAAKLPEDVVVINISMDLPFAISRFCTTTGIDKVRAYSDHRDASFGNAYGVLIKELRLLTRSIFVIDKSNIIKYVEIVPEITEQPKYDRVHETVLKQ